MGKPQKPSLTIKQQRFCEEFVANGYDDYKAVLAAGYTYTTKDKDANKNNAKIQGKTLLRNEKVRNKIGELLQEEQDQFIVNKTYVLKKLKLMAEQGLTENTKLKALELIGKTMQMFSDKDNNEQFDNPAETGDNAFERRLSLIKGDNDGNVRTDNQKNTH